MLPLGEPDADIRGSQRDVGGSTRERSHCLGPEVLQHRGEHQERLLHGEACAAWERAERDSQTSCLADSSSAMKHCVIPIGGRVSTTNRQGPLQRRRHQRACQCAFKP